MVAVSLLGGKKPQNTPEGWIFCEKPSRRARRA